VLFNLYMFGGTGEVSTTSSSSVCFLGNFGNDDSNKFNNIMYTCKLSDGPSNTEPASSNKLHARRRVVSNDFVYGSR
jgi:hypothetical protein